MYLIEKDFYHIIRKNIFDKILTDIADATGCTNEDIWRQAEESALRMMSAYLCARFDVDQLLKEYVVYNAADSYVVGDFIYDDVNSLFYTCIQDSTAPATLTDTAFFTEGDTRDPLIKTLLIDILLYEVHSSINPRNIPELRIDRKMDAKEYLNMVIDPRNNLCPKGWPLKQNDENSGNDITWGSNGKLNHGQDCY